MRKGLKVIIASMAITATIAMGAAIFTTASANETTETQKDAKYSLEEMLTYAIKEQYMTQAEYEAINEKFGEQLPYSNMLRSNERQIDLLEQLCEEYKVAIPKTDWDKQVVLPDSIEDSYKKEIADEEKNIKTYDNYLKQELQDDVKLVFERLKAISEHHLYVFENAVEGNIICETGGYGSRNGGCGNGMMRGNGLRNGTGLGRGCNGVGRTASGNFN